MKPGFVGVRDRFVASDDSALAALAGSIAPDRQNTRAIRRVKRSARMRPRHRRPRCARISATRYAHAGKGMKHPTGLKLCDPAGPSRRPRSLRIPRASSVRMRRGWMQHKRRLVVDLSEKQKSAIAERSDSGQLDARKSLPMCRARTDLDPEVAGAAKHRADADRRCPRSDRGADRAQCSRHEGAGTETGLEAPDLRRGHFHSGSPFFSSTLRGYRSAFDVPFHAFPKLMVPHPGAERPGAEADQCCGLVRNECLTPAGCHSTRPQRSDPGSTRPVLPARYWFSSAKLWLASDAVVVPVAGAGSVTVIGCGAEVRRCRRPGP